MTTRSSSRRSSTAKSTTTSSAKTSSAPAKDTQPAASDVKQTPSAPLNVEKETPTTEPEAPSEKAPAETIQTDVREKLRNKDVENDVFVPTNPVALEKAAETVAEEQGFELNRGTSIGARLMARARKNP